VWVKTNKKKPGFFMGAGYTTRKNVEISWLGRRGNPRRLSKSVRELIIAPRREHSRKPDEVYGRIEQFCAGPYVELFARQQRPGWLVWGDQVDRFNGGSA
jgi:N6-adenosine-specific RNA methylase IME4